MGVISSLVSQHPSSLQLWAMAGAPAVPLADFAELRKLQVSFFLEQMKLETSSSSTELEHEFDGTVFSTGAEEGKLQSLSSQLSALTGLLTTVAAGPTSASIPPQAQGAPQAAPAASAVPSLQASKQVPGAGPGLPAGQQAQQVYGFAGAGLSGR